MCTSLHTCVRVHTDVPDTTTITTFWLLRARGVPVKSFYVGPPSSSQPTHPDCVPGGRADRTRYPSHTHVVLSELETGVIEIVSVHNLTIKAT